MVNIKNITKKLIDAGYSEEKLILMTEKEIRETYKNYKSSPKEDDSILSSPNTTPENNDNTTSIVKEETTMKNEMIKEMKKLARKYDAFTHCIDDCRQREDAEKRNKVLDTKFVEIANKMGINATANDLYEIISNDYDSFDEAIEAYIKSHEVKVVSSTLTKQNGELTFVELSPEQKLEIYKILDDQLKDVNYSSWFEEENGVFKLYGSWVDEDSAVKEEYYFNGNKLIKIEKEESIMKDDNTTVSINSETTVEEKEETSMSKTKIRRDSHESFESWINRINDLLSSNGIHLDNDKLLTIIDDETNCVSIESEDLNVHGWCAGEPFYCCYDFHGTLKEYSDEGTNFESVEVEKEEDIMTNNANTTETNNNVTIAVKEESTMTVNNTTNNVTINNNTNIKEETIMKTRTTQELINDALNISKIQDENYVTNAMLREEYKKLTGNVIGSNKTRPVIIKAIQDELHKEPAKPAPDDAKVLTYRLMHKIGDHALSNRKKGFGTTISAKMLCAFIVEVASSNDPEPIDRLYVPTGKKDKYGKPITMVNPKITEEHKNKCKDVRKWLLNHGYIKPVTFKDEKGFTFYTPEYDGNRKDKMYDCTKFKTTGKVETTTYRVTKEMNKWYV